MALAASRGIQLAQRSIKPTIFATDELHPTSVHVSSAEALGFRGLASVLLGMTLNRRQLHQAFSQQIEGTLRHQLFEGFAIAREKELFTLHWLIS